MKLQKLIFITLLAVGLLPLLLFISLNFPKIMMKLQQSGEERQLLALQQDFHDLNNLMQRRQESLQNLSHIPGILDLATPTENEVSTPLIRKRLSELLKRWYDSKEDINRISIIDSKGKERLSLSRNSEGHLQLDPRNSHVAEEHSNIHQERVYYNDPSTTFSTGVHLHKSAGKNKKIPHTHQAVTIGRSPGSSKGVAIMHIDLQSFLDKYPDYFLMRGDGAYIRTPGSKSVNSQPEPGEALEDFRKLEPLLDSPKPATLSHKELGNTSLLPLVVDDHRENSLWVGHKVTREDIKEWLTSFLTVFIIILLAMIFIIVAAANKVSSKIDGFVKDLTTGLTGLLESYTPVKFSWNWPNEIKVLGEDLTRLADKYLASNRAREETEKELQGVSRQQQMILSSAAEGILGIDNDGCIIFANQSAEAMFGYKRGELLNKNAHDTLHYQKPDGSRYPRGSCPFCEALSRQDPTLSTEDIFWLSNGTSIDVKYNASPMLDELGTPQGAVMCIQDISLRKKQEREMEKLQEKLLHSQKMEAIGTLAGGVAHDFNNLLTVITANSEVLALSLDKQSELFENSREITAAAERATDLTRQLLSFSRKEAIKTTPVDLNKLIKGMEKMANRLIGEGIEIEFQEGRQLNLIQADPGQMEQVLMNLIVNARDAMPEGGLITLTTGMVNIDDSSLSAIPESRTGTFALLAVSDNGSGITREEKAKIFDPFFSTKGADKGTGLGLSVVYGIVQQHGGWINVYSEPGKGTAFKIYLPVLESENEACVPDSSEDKGALPSGNNEKILLVEDDDQVRHIASALLTRDGYQVREAAAIQEGLEIFKEEEINIRLLISDVVLPDGYGLDLADQLLTRSPGLPVIICSGYADDKSRWPLIKDKGLPFIQKPFTRVDLLDTVKSAMAEKTKTTDQNFSEP